MLVKISSKCGRIVKNSLSNKIMNKKLWVYCWLTFPLVFPMLFFMREMNGDKDGILDSIHVLLRASFIIGGAQYALMMPVVLYKYRDKNFEFWHKFSWTLPLIYLPIALIGIEIYGLIVYHSDMSRGLFLFILPALFVCYAWVFLYHLFTSAALRLNLIRD